MIEHVLPALACPHCRGSLERMGAAVGCPNGHRFDLARQGYVSLLGPGARTDTGDTAEMVAARVAFLGTGRYAPLAAGVAAAVAPAARRVLDLGAGTGYYLAAVLDARSSAVGLALDSSARAIRRAVAAHPRIGAVVSDAWATLPVRDAAVDAVLSVFAPRNPGEIHRVLAADGELVVATPTPVHLAELRGAVGLLRMEPDKEDRLGATLAAGFTRVGATPIEYQLTLDRDDLSNIVLMGPAAYHVDRAELRAAVDRIAPATATCSVLVTRWRPRGSGAADVTGG